jgi:hypothetical protein
MIVFPHIAFPFLAIQIPAQPPYFARICVQFCLYHLNIVLDGISWMKRDIQHFFRKTPLSKHRHACHSNYEWFTSDLLNVRKQAKHLKAYRWNRSPYELISLLFNRHALNLQALVNCWFLVKAACGCGESFPDSEISSTYPLASNCPLNV